MPVEGPSDQPGRSIALCMTINTKGYLQSKDRSTMQTKSSPQKDEAQVGQSTRNLAPVTDHVPSPASSRFRLSGSPDSTTSPSVSAANVRGPNVTPEDDLAVTRSWIYVCCLERISTGRCRDCTNVGSSLLLVFVDTKMVKQLIHWKWGGGGTIKEKAKCTMGHAPARLADSDPQASYVATQAFDPLGFRI